MTFNWSMNQSYKYLLISLMDKGLVQGFEICVIIPSGLMDDYLNIDSRKSIFSFLL